MKPLAMLDARVSSAGPSFHFPFSQGATPEKEELYILETLTSCCFLPREDRFTLHSAECVYKLFSESKQGFFARLSLGNGATKVTTAFLQDFPEPGIG